MDQVEVKVKPEYRPELSKTWVYIGKGRGRDKVLDELEGRIEDVLGKEGKVEKKNSLGLPSPILEITFTKDNSKLEAVKEIIGEFQ